MSLNARLTADQIEADIDHHGLVNILTAIECVASEKADHIRASYSDKILAKRWDALSKRLSTLLRDFEDIA